MRTGLCSRLGTILIASMMIGCGDGAAGTASTTSPSEGSPHPGNASIPEREIAEAIAFRELYGLVADATWVRAVARDPAAQLGVPEFGVPLTPDEFADLMSRRWDPDLFTQVRNYGLLFPDDFAGAYINLKGSGVIAAFKARVDRHRVALSNLVPEGSIFAIREVEWSLQDLVRLVKEVEAETVWFESVGVQVNVSEDIVENHVHVRFRGPKNAAGMIEHHFQNPSWLQAEWTGPIRWDGPRAELSIEVVDATGKPAAAIRCEAVPVDDNVDASSDTTRTTNVAGICVLPNYPVAIYDIRLYRWVDDVGYDPIPVATARRELEPGGTRLKVVIGSP